MSRPEVADIPFSNTPEQHTRNFENQTMMFDSFRMMTLLGIKSLQMSRSQHGQASRVLGSQAEEMFHAAQALQVGHIHDWRDFFPWVFFKTIRNHGFPLGGGHRWIQDVYDRHGLIETFDGWKLAEEIRDSAEEPLDDERPY